LALPPKNTLMFIIVFILTPRVTLESPLSALARVS